MTIDHWRAVIWAKLEVCEEVLHWASVLFYDRAINCCLTFGCFGFKGSWRGFVFPVLPVNDCPLNNLCLCCVGNRHEESYESHCQWFVGSRFESSGRSHTLFTQLVTICSAIKNQLPRSRSLETNTTGWDIFIYFLCESISAWIQ